MMADGKFWVLTPVLISMICLVVANESYAPCNVKHPLNLSNDTCGDLCGKGTLCAENGACMCSKEPGASMLGGHFTHCTNWDYVEQKGCTTTCTTSGKSDHRVCWTFDIGNYCTCFDKKGKPPTN